MSQWHGDLLPGDASVCTRRCTAGASPISHASQLLFLSQTPTTSSPSRLREFPRAASLSIFSAIISWWLKKRQNNIFWSTLSCVSLTVSFRTIWARRGKKIKTRKCENDNSLDSVWFRLLKHSGFFFSLSRVSFLFYFILFYLLFPPLFLFRLSAACVCVCVMAATERQSAKQQFGIEGKLYRTTNFPSLFLLLWPVFFLGWFVCWFVCLFSFGILLCASPFDPARLCRRRSFFFE